MTLLKSIFWTLIILALSACGPQGYIRDDDQILWRIHMRGVDEVVQTSDPNQFIVTDLLIEDGMRVIAIDHEHVFYYGGIIEGADPQSFGRFVDQYWADLDHLFFQTGNGNFVLLEQSDPSSFFQIDDFTTYTRDKDTFYYFNLPFEVTDPETFEVLPQKGWARDAFNFYYKNRPIDPLSADTFTIIEKPHPWFGHDEEKISWEGVSIPEIDPKTFEPHPTKGTICFDKDFIYQIQIQDPRLEYFRFEVYCEPRF
jgi:hypothetical protein